MDYSFTDLENMKEALEVSITSLTGKEYIQVYNTIEWIRLKQVEILRKLIQEVTHGRI